MRLRLRLTLCLPAALAVAACAPAGGGIQAMPAEIVIASDFPTSSGVFGNGLALQHAAQLAVAQHPTIHGFKLTLRPFDYAAGVYPEVKAGQIAQEIVGDSRILGVIGPSNSYVAALQAPILNSGGVPAIAPSTTVDCLTLAATCPMFSSANLRPTGRLTFFRLAAPDSMQGRVMADFAFHTLGVRKVAVLNEPGPYARGVAAALEGGLAGDGASVVVHEEFDPSVVTFIPWLSRARAAGAQAIYAAGSASTRICLAREQAQHVFTNDVYFLVPDGLVTQACLEQARDNLSDKMYGTVASAGPTPGSDQAAHVIAQLRRSFPADRQPQPYVLTTYDATLILIDAIARAIDVTGGRIPTRGQVLKALAATKATRGVAGSYTFTSSGDNADAEVSVYQVRGDGWAFLTSLPPAARLGSSPPPSG